MAETREQLMVSLINRDQEVISDLLKKSFRFGNGSRQAFLDYLDNAAEKIGYKITDFDPQLLMQNETIREGLVGVFIGRHGNGIAFSDIVDIPAFITEDLQISFERDKSKW